MNTSRMIAGGIVIASMALAGCEGQVTVDVATTAPASGIASDVFVDLRGVEFRKDDGGTERVEFDEPQTIDLTDYQQGDLLRLLTDEELADGRYNGARLLFEEGDDDNPDGIVAIGNDDFELILTANTAFSDVDFTVDKDDSSRDRIVLTLDLRQSLAFDDDNDTFTFTPHLVGVVDENAGQLTGTVTANCSAGGAITRAAAYVFEGQDVTPDDRDGADPNPYLTTAVEIASSNAAPTYSFPFLPEGDYTLALTCEGDEEDAASDDSGDLSFQNAVNVDVDAEARTTSNIQ